MNVCNVPQADYFSLIDYSQHYTSRSTSNYSFSVSAQVLMCADGMVAVKEPVNR